MSNKTGGILQAARRAYRGELPPRYHTEPWAEPFRSLPPDIRILDVGSGARPMLPPEARPPGSSYTGLDAAASELEKAPERSYDATYVADIRHARPELRGEFDLVIAWMVLEHVKPLAPAVENIRSYLRPGGRLIAQLPGTFSPFALLNRATPRWLKQRLLARLNDRPPETVFPAYYDRCWHSALTELFAPWGESTVTPLYLGAHYLRFSRLLTALYVGYEEWAYRGDHRNLAGYYLITARA